MFPIPFNIPFRKKDGSLSTLGDELNNGGGGSSYTLPTASADTKGGVKIGAGLTMDGEVLKNTNPTPPTPYTLPTASAETLGGIKVGSGLSIDDGVLSTSGGGGDGGKLYYKEFNVTSYANALDVTETIKIYTFNTNVNVTNYKPVSIIGVYNNTPVEPAIMIPTLDKRSETNFRFSVLTNVALGTSTSPNMKVRVFYRPTTDIEVIS